MNFEGEAVIGGLGLLSDDVHDQTLIDFLLSELPLDSLSGLRVLKVSEGRFPGDDVEDALAAAFVLTVEDHVAQDEAVIGVDCLHLLGYLHPPDMRRGRIDVVYLDRKSARLVCDSVPGGEAFVGSVRDDEVEPVLIRISDFMTIGDLQVVYVQLGEAM